MTDLLRRFVCIAHVLCVLTAFVSPLSCRAASAPFLRFDDPFTSTLWRIGLSSDGETTVGGLSAGSVAVWRADQLEHPRLLHLPIRNEEARRARPAAVSPDGRTIAYAVPLLQDGEGRAIARTALIYLIDAQSLRIERQIDGIETRPQDLKFSRDGRFLAAALSDGCGVRVWRIDGTLVARDDSEVEDCTRAKVAGTGRDTLSVLFPPEQSRAWLVSSGAAGVRAYAWEAQRLVPLLHLSSEALGLDAADGIAASPDGRQLVVGGRPRGASAAVTAVRIVSLEDEVSAASVRVLALGADDGVNLRRLDPSVHADARQFKLARVAWGRLGEQEWIFAAGVLPCDAVSANQLVGEAIAGAAELCAVGWPMERHAARRPLFFPVGTEQANDVAVSEARSVVVFATERSLVSLSQQRDGPPGAAQWTRRSAERAAADLRDSGQHFGELLGFAVSDNASVVQLRTYPGRTGRSTAVRFDLASLDLNGLPDSGAPVHLHQPRVDIDVVEPLDGWVNSTRPPRLRGAAPVLAPSAADRYRAATAMPEGLWALVSANFLRVLADSAEEPREICATRLLSEGFRVNASSDGRWIVVAHGDGTLRWYRLTLAEGRGHCTIENVLAVHLRQVRDTDQYAWIAWKPQTGEFAMDVRVKSILQWQIVDAQCRQAVVPFGELTQSLYDRTAVQRALVDAADGDAGKLSDRLDAYCSTYRTAFLSPRVHTRWRTLDIPFRVRITGSARAARVLVSLGGAQRLAKVVDGRPYAPDEPVLLSSGEEHDLTVTLPLASPPKGAEFHVCIEVERDRDCHLLVWDGQEPTRRPRRLWSVLIGVSDYGVNGARDTRSLRFAQNDVMDLASVFLADRDSQQLAVAQGTRTAADFDGLSIQLFLAALPSAHAKAEIDALKDQPGVAVASADAHAIYQAIDDVASRIAREGSPDDLFLLYFSGHGMAAPRQQMKGASVLLLPSRHENRSFEPQDGEHLDSGELLSRLAKVGASKLVVFDACRSVDYDPRAAAFDAGKMRSEFETQLPSAALLFSTKPGFKSQESDRLSYSTARGAGGNGNGVFSYVLLTELTRKLPARDLVPENDRRRRVSVESLGIHIRDFFEDAALTDPATFRQRPEFIPAHMAEPVYIRTRNLAQ